MRELFDIPESVCYLNCAYMAPLAREVADAGRVGVDRKRQPWEIEPADFFTQSEHTRALFARLVNASADDVSFAPSVSYALTLASRNIPVSRHQTVVVLAEQFPSNVYPWLELARSRDATVQTVSRREGESWTDAVVAAIDTGRAAVVALPHVRWTDGELLDLEVIADRCRRHGTALVIDATQSLGALGLDVARVRPSFLACATYKWLLGPYSMAFLYADPAFQQGTPLEYSWITRGNAEDFRGLVDYRPDFQAGARRYDMGERSNFALMPMTAAALELILKWDPEHVQRTLTRYTGEIESRARSLGLVTASPPARAGHFLGIRFPKGIPDDAVGELRRRNIHVSVRGDCVRITPHLYNTENDKHCFLEALEQLAQSA
ncbi:MAG: aminotransferase class V-fold PLP-dependent enzyme [Proteobacteria bacterium]|nr:MAG: aminotransferase class V-fold PLP-dependent enzyme [Pseudomonadota bacterium]